MSRSGYTDGSDDNWQLIKWRGQVASSIRGSRGQAFLREMLAAMDALPVKELIAHDLDRNGAVCAIGSLGRARGIDMSSIDPEDYDRVAGVFGVAPQLAQEVVYMNDEGTYRTETPYQRFERMRSWIVANIKGDLPSKAEASHD